MLHFFNTFSKMSQLQCLQKLKSYNGWGQKSHYIINPYWHTIYKKGQINMPGNKYYWFTLVLKITTLHWWECNSHLANPVTSEITFTPTSSPVFHMLAHKEQKSIPLRRKERSDKNNIVFIQHSGRYIFMDNLTVLCQSMHMKSPAIMIKV